MNERRPDIQVIENRINRLYDQLSLYKGKAIYGITQERLNLVQDKLIECECLITEILREGKRQGRGNKQPALITESGLSNNQSDEFDGDLSDDLSNILSEFQNKDISKYSPKFIVSTYRKNLEECSQLSTGILQINQFINVVNCWFARRYSSDPANSGFRYKADRINEWIDLIILAGGLAIHNNMFAVFRTDFEKWIAQINSDSDRNWILPQTIMQFKSASSYDYTEEAILIERVFKKNLYNDNFYPSKKDSVEKIVIESERFGKDRLSTEQIVEDCKGVWVVTSSFDPNQY